KQSSLREYLRATKIDVGVAMALAGGINIAMLVLAATALQGQEGTYTLEGVFASLNTNLGSVVAYLFAVGLLASGFASTSIGSQAGAVIMQGLLKKRISLFM